MLEYELNGHIANIYTETLIFYLFFFKVHNKAVDIKFKG